MKMYYAFIIILMTLAVLAFGIMFFVNNLRGLKAKPAISENMIKISSTAFVNGQAIPQRYTCDGQNISPEISISGVPETTRSLVLTVEDLDSPSKSFSHWVVFNIDPSTKEIPENAPINAIVGKNDFGNLGYGGPCPGSGVHRYYFDIFALDEVLSIPQDSNRSDVNKAMEGHIIGRGRLMGTYSRLKKL